MEKVLAIDYGRARIGLAISDPLGIAVRPLPALAGRDLAAAITALGELCEEEQVGRLVIGIPYQLDGTEGHAVAEVRRFRGDLCRAIGLDCDEVDERLTSKQAHAVLKDAGMKHRQRRARVDSSAAVLMLQSYLAGRSRSSGS